MQFVLAAILLACLCVSPAYAQSSGKENLFVASAHIDMGRHGTISYSVTRRDGQIIGGRPSGCPHRYCGCASALKIGLPNPDGRWNLARNWFAFPAAAPGPGMADVRRGHVRIILAAVGDGLYRFYDPNSGRGLTRIHIDRLRGRVVNPHARRFASR